MASMDFYFEPQNTNELLHASCSTTDTEQMRNKILYHFKQQLSLKQLHIKSRNWLPLVIKSHRKTIRELGPVRITFCISKKIIEDVFLIFKHNKIIVSKYLTKCIDGPQLNPVVTAQQLHFVIDQVVNFLLGITFIIRWWSQHFVLYRVTLNFGLQKSYNFISFVGAAFI